MDMDFQKRLEKAALDGVVDRLEQRQVKYVISFLKKCAFPKKIYESKKVKDWSLAYLKKNIRSCVFLRDGDLEEAIELVKAIKVPDEDVFKTIQESLYEDLQWHKTLPICLECVLESFSVPVDYFNKNRFLNHKVVQEIMNGMNYIDIGRRSSCFLKYFCLPTEAIEVLVKSVLKMYSCGAVADGESGLDEFIEASGFDQEKVKRLATTVVSEMILTGDMNEILIGMEEVQVLADKYDLDLPLIIGQISKESAVKSALEMGYCGEMDGFEKIVILFKLSREDFKESGLIEAIKFNLESERIPAAEKLIEFAGLSRDKVAPLIREKLENLVRLKIVDLRLFTEKYGVEWNEVVKAAENEFVEKLACSGSKRLKIDIDDFGFTKEFLNSDRVTLAAKEGLIRVYENADVNNNADFLINTFGLKI